MSSISDRFLKSHIPLKFAGEDWEIIRIDVEPCGWVKRIDLSFPRGNHSLTVKRDDERAFIAHHTSYSAPFYWPNVRHAPLLDVLRAIEGVADQMLPEHRAAFDLTFAELLAPPKPKRRSRRGVR